MKLLVSLSYYYPNISGITKYVENLTDGLVEKNHQITILTSNHANIQKEEINKNGVKIIRVPVTFRIGKGVFMLKYPFEVYNQAKQTDVINCHIPEFESFIVAIIAKILGKKLYVTHHTDIQFQFGIINILSFIALFLSHTITCILADKIISHTKDYVENSYQMNFFKNKITYILPPVKPIPRVNRKQHKGFNLAFLGRMSSEKGIECLIKSIPYIKESFDEFRIIIAGSQKVIGENVISELSNLIEKYKDIIVMRGQIHENDMANFFSEIDLLILPSTNKLEAFGLVQVEAFFSGIPVVSSNLPGVREVIKLSKMGETFEVSNSEDLSKKITKVLKNQESYIQPHEEIYKIFNYEDSIKSYEKLFLV